MIAQSNDSRRDVLAFAPTSHPDFVMCNDPRVAQGHHKPLVYVPSLVYLIHRLGGPEMISNGLDDDGQYSPTTLVTDRTDRTIVSALATGTDAGLFVLTLDHWHNANDFLAVHLHVPDRWHTGEWTVGGVTCEGMVSVSAELDRDLALLCNRTIGMNLADSKIW